MSWLTDRSVRRQCKAFESGLFMIISHRSLTVCHPTSPPLVTLLIKDINVGIHSSDPPRARQGDPGGQCCGT